MILVANHSVTKKDLKLHIKIVHKKFIVNIVTKVLAEKIIWRNTSIKTIHIDLNSKFNKFKNEQD